MKPIIYVIANKALNMSAGKLAAQVGHAVAASILLSPHGDRDNWDKAVHKWMIVLEGENAEHLYSIERYLTDRGVHADIVIDEGVNEIRPFTPTALGVQILDKDEDGDLLYGLSLYRGRVPIVEPTMPGRWWKRG
jgi:peptidyl-tRNA hydrolase